MKKVFNILLSVVLIFGLAALVAFAETGFYRKPLSDWSVNVEITGPDTLISPGEISDLVLDRFDSLKGTQLSEVKLSEIRAAVNQQEYVENCDIKLTMQGWMEIAAKQRDPVVRVMNGQGGFYLDEAGRYMPVTAGKPAYVPVITSEKKLTSQKPGKPGEPLTLNDPLLSAAFDIIRLIREDTLLTGLIDQIHIRDDGEFELISKIPGPTVLLGPPEDLEEKLWHLRWFYIKVLPSKGWKTYKEINLKYNKQVICSK